MKRNIILIIILQLILITSLSAQVKYSAAWQARVDSAWRKLDVTSPIFINGNNIHHDVGANVAYSCILVPHSDMMQFAYVFFDKYRNKKNDKSGGYIFSKAIKTMLTILYGKPMQTIDLANNIFYPLIPIPSSRTQFRGNLDTTKLVENLNGKFTIENAWTIQVTSSANIKEEQTKKQMLFAIEQQFGLKTYMEKQLKKCVVISRNNIPIPEYSGGKTDLRVRRNKDKLEFISVNNIPLQHLLDRLEMKFPDMGYPIINETGFTKNLGMISFTTNDPQLTVENLMENLPKFGIKVTIEEREVEVLIIEKAA